MGCGDSFADKRTQRIQNAGLETHSHENVLETKHLRLRADPLQATGQAQTVLVQPMLSQPCALNEQNGLKVL